MFFLQGFSRSRVWEPRAWLPPCLPAAALPAGRCCWTPAFPRAPQPKPCTLWREAGWCLLCVSSCFETEQDKNVGTGFERRRGIFTRAGHIKWLSLAPEMQRWFQLSNPSEIANKEERRKVGQRKSRDSKHCVHLPIFLGSEITTCQPLLPEPQNPGDCSVPGWRLSLPSLALF